MNLLILKYFFSTWTYNNNKKNMYTLTVLLLIIFDFYQYYLSLFQF